MKFKPITKTLFTDDKKIIKKMHCPYAYKLAWGDLLEIDGSIDRYLILEDNR